MKISRLKAPRTLEIADVPGYKLLNDQALIKVRCVGICGTDVAVYRGDYKAKDNVILGHEYCGEIVQTGENVTRYQVGDFVTSGASWGCGSCYWCTQGQPSYCETPNMLGRTIDGSLAEYIAVPERTLYKLDKDTTPLEGQGVVGIATALRVIERAQVKLGDNILIIGPGYGGLIILQLCKLSGASVGVVGTRDERLAIAENLKADFTENIKGQEDWEQNLLGKYSKYGFDVVIEAAGTPSAFLSAVKLVKKGGRILEFGTSFDVLNGIPQKDFYSREISIIGSKGGFGKYNLAVEILKRKIVEIEPLITHTYPFAEVGKAFEVMDKRLENVLRAAVLF